MTRPRLLDQAWRDHAKCAGMDTAMFFHDGAGRMSDVDRRRINQAIAVCQGCPVAVECEADANRHGEYGQVRGGRFRAWPKGRRGDAIEFVPVDRCGSEAGYGAHRRAGTTPCRACKDAHNRGDWFRAHVDRGEQASG